MASDSKSGAGRPGVKPIGEDDPLVCPYTGNPITVRFAPGNGLYSAGGMFRPQSMKFATEGQARMAMAMRNGKPVRYFMENPADAYTGTKVTFVRREGSWIVVGAFRPDQVFAEKSVLVHALKHRDGVPPSFPARSKLVVVGEVRPPELNPASDLDAGAAAADGQVKEVVHNVVTSAQSQGGG